MLINTVNLKISWVSGYMYWALSHKKQDMIFCAFIIIHLFGRSLVILRTVNEILKFMINLQ